MAENEKEVNKIDKTHFLSEETDEAKPKLLYKSKVYPNYNAVQDLPQQYQENQEIKQSDQSDTKLYQSVNNQIKRTKHMNDDETKQNLYSIIATNTFQMRLRVLDMETNILKTYFNKQLIDNEKDTWKNINKIKMYVNVTYTFPKNDNFEQAENELLIAENLSAALMTKIEEVLYTKAAEKEVVRNPKHNIQVPNCRLIVTVRGTEEDIFNCILKDTAALESGKYDRAESLLLKAERIIPTRNARDLLKQVRAAGEPKQNSEESSEMAIKVTEQINFINEEESNTEDNSRSAVKCMTIFEIAFTTGNYEKAERMLNKAKRLDLSLDLTEKLSQVKTAIHNKVVEEKRKQEIEKLKKKEKIRNEIAFERSKKCKNTDKTGPEKTVTESDVKYAPEYFYNVKQQYDAGEYEEAQRMFYGAKGIDSSLDSEAYLSTCRDEITSRTSAEGKEVVSKKVTDPVINHKNKHTRLKLEKYNQAKSSYETNIVQILCYKGQKVQTQIEKGKKEVKGKGNSKIKKNEINKIYEDQKRSINNIKDKVDTRVDKDAETCKSGECSKEKTLNRPKLHEMDQFANKTRYYVTNSDRATRDARITYATAIVKSLKEQVENGSQELKTCNYFSKYNSDPNTTILSSKTEGNKTLMMVKKSIHYEKLENAMNFLKTEEELYSTEQAKELQRNMPVNCDEFLVKDNESDQTEALKLKKEAEMLKNLAVEAMHRSKFHVACFYLDQALKKQLDEQTKELLQIARSKQNRQYHRHHHSLKNDFMFEADKQLNKANDLIPNGGLEEAEFFLTVSWDLYTSKHTILVYNKFLEARIARFERNMKYKRDENSQNEQIYISDKYVKFALDMYECNKYEEAEKLLMSAAAVYLSDRIDKLLFEIREIKNGENGNIKKNINFALEKLDKFR